MSLQNSYVKSIASVAKTALFTALLLQVACRQQPARAPELAAALADNQATPLLPPLLPALSRQLVMVISDNWQASSGRLYLFHLVQGQWQAAQLPGGVGQGIGSPGSVDLGRNGSAWGLGLHPTQSGLQKQEGDGKAPAGLFRLSGAFGALPGLATKMPYQQMSRFDYCIDVPTSPLYNQTLDVRQYRPEWTAGSSEPMRRDLAASPDNVYLQGLFIDHNFSGGEARQTAAGSCIFMHQKSAEGGKTAGCTALSADALTQLLQWLDPAAEPLYLLLPKAEYQRLQQPWQLPALER